MNIQRKRLFDALLELELLLPSNADVEEGESCSLLIE